MARMGKLEVKIRHIIVFTIPILVIRGSILLTEVTSG